MLVTYSRLSALVFSRLHSSQLVPYPYLSFFFFLVLVRLLFRCCCSICFPFCQPPKLPNGSAVTIFWIRDMDVWRRISFFCPSESHTPILHSLPRSRSILSSHPHPFLLFSTFLTHCDSGHVLLASFFLSCYCFSLYLTSCHPLGWKGNVLDNYI
jgi:hypothetical protein